MQRLDARLMACAAYLQPGKRVADVGCDHGKLTAYLAQNGFSVIATDINEKPLECARKTCQSANCSELVSLRLGDGLSPLAPMEAQQVVIAGVSPDTMFHIIDSAPWLQTQGMRLVLCPATRLPQLRKGLCLRGFEIMNETPVVAAGRCYSVLCAEYTANAFEPDEKFCLIGKIAGKPFAQELRDDTARKMQKQLRGLQGTEQEQQGWQLLEWLKNAQV